MLKSKSKSKSKVHIKEFHELTIFVNRCIIIITSGNKRPTRRTSKVRPTVILNSTRKTKSKSNMKRNYAGYQY
ncbi:hypothetical protein HanPSC8_Chr13g0591301 [Helianthus annuus]|nr:hypothetical protein HanPSC8_Chr13g0591301 [Helianthus annuus]